MGKRIQNRRKVLLNKLPLVLQRRVIESKTERDETITLDNPEFAYIFNNNDEPKTKEFVEKYRGEIIEFDGHISGMW